MSQDTDHDAARRDLSGAFGRPLTSSLRGLLPPRAATARGGADPDASSGPAPEDLDEDLPDDQLDDDEPDDEFDDEDADEEFDDGDVEPDEPDEPDDPAAVAPAAGRDRPPRRPGARAVSAAHAARRPEPPRGPERVPPTAPRERAARPSAAAVGTPPLEATRVRRTEAPRSSGERAASSPTRTGGSVNRRWGIARIASRDHVDLLVLLALDQGAGSGREVIRRLRADSGDLLDAPEQTVHRTLHRLARNRLVVRRSDRSGRITYALSETGRRSMLARVREWRALSRAFGAVLSERSL